MNTTRGPDPAAGGRGRGAGAVRPKLQQYTQKRLEKMGVEIRLNTLAVGMDDESVTVKGPDGEETIRCRTRIWAAGVQASPLATMLGREGGRRDRPGGPDPGQPGLHGRRASRGVRGRRHGVAQQAARRGAARDAGGQVRRQGDQGPAGGRRADRAVQVLRQGLDGHDRAPAPPSPTRSACSSPACSATRCGASSTCCT